MSIDFKNDIKNIKTTSPDYKLFAGGNCPEPCPIYQFAIKSLLSVLFSSLTNRNLNNSRPRHAFFFFEKWVIITEIFNSWKIQNVSIFYFWKNSPKNGQIFQLFTLYSKGRHFSITKLDILIFCNILHHEMDFWNLSWKRIVSW